jgi:hypothetical protein
VKKTFKTLLAKFDKTIVKLAGWNHTPYSKNNFMYLAPHIYKGRTIQLKDGTVISKGDLVGEIHIDNINASTLDTRYPNLIRLFRGELIALKQCFLEEIEPYSKIKAVHGNSVFYDIAARQGFTIIEIRNVIKRFFISIGENILRLGLKSGNNKTRKKFLMSKECWISQDQIKEMK